MFTEICDGAGTGICDGAPSTCSSRTAFYQKVNSILILVILDTLTKYALIISATEHHH